MKFATKLTILLLAIIVLSGITISFFVYSSNLKTLEGEITHKLEHRALDTMDKIDRNLYERYSDIQMMATDPIIRSRNSTPKQITERLIEYRNIYKTYISLSFFDLNRIRVADTSGMSIGEQNELEIYFEESSQGKVSAASDIKMSSTVNQPIIYFASPVKDKNGEIFGAVVARMPSTKLYEITGGGIHEEEEELEIDLVDKNGLLLYSNTNRKGILEDNYADHECIKLSMAGEKTGTMIHLDPIDKEEDLSVFIHEQGYLDFKGNDWTLSVHIPTKIVFAPAVELRNKLIIILAVIVPLVFLVSFIFSRSISKPIQELTECARRIKQGDLSHEVKPTSKDEIGELAETFDEMRLGLKDRNSLLDSLLNTFKGKFGSIATILVRKDVQELVKKNPRIEKILPKSLGVSVTKAKKLERERERKKN